MAKIQKKRPGLAEGLRSAVIAAPNPRGRISRIHLILSKNFFRIAVMIILAMALSGIIFMAAKESKEKKYMENRLLGYEKAVNGTQIEVIRGAIEQKVASGTAPVAKQQALSGFGSYVCYLTTERGIIILKKKDSLMRQETTMSGYNFSVIFIEDKLYIYHPQYHKWAMFPYDDDSPISTDFYTSSVFSLSELRAMNETNSLCIEAELPDDEFSLRGIEVMDAEKAIASTKFLR